MILKLPLPPSSNNMFINVPRRGRIKSTAYKDWRDKSALIVKSQARSQSPVNGPYSVSIHLPAKMRGDLDNRCKPVLDLLVAAQITDDDKHCQKIEISRSVDVDASSCMVRVYPA